MQHVGTLIKVSLVCFFIVGCSDPRSTARKKLSKQIDIARRMYNRAIALQANPPYVEKKTGKRSPITHPLASVEDIAIPTTRYAENPDVEKVLTKAADILRKAISTYSQAPVSTRADAELLLGDILLAKAEYHRGAAARVSDEVALLRQRTIENLWRAQNNAVLVQFNHVLANMPKDKVIALQQETQKELTRLDNEISSNEAEKARLKAENTKLGKQNESLQAQALALRDKSEQARGIQGLDLLKKAQSIEDKINKNTSRIASNLQKIKRMDFDAVRLQQERHDTGLKLQAIKKRLQEMEISTSKAAEAEKAAKDAVVKEQQKVIDLIKQIVELSGKVATLHKDAVSTFKEAEKHIGIAEKLIRSKIATERAALMKQAIDERKGFIRANYEEHLILITSLRGSANLSMAVVLSRELAMARNNALLAETVKATWEKLGPGRILSPELIDKLEKYLPDSQKVQATAEENYKIAEKYFEKTLNLHPASTSGKNTVWNCQALLANAYLGHFHLTHDPAILNKAKELVNKALEGKRGSPYLAPVAELQKIMP